MFKKIISQLSFSPVTVERLGEYAKSIRKRQHIHGWAILVLLLLITAQLITMSLPVNPVVQPTSNDLIPGGLPSRETVLSAYDNNSDGFKDTASLFSITRSNLASANMTDFCLKEASALYTTSRVPYLEAKQVSTYEVSGEPIYIQPLSERHPVNGWCGISENGKTFFINATDGNIVSPELPNDRGIQTNLVKSLNVDSLNAQAGQSITWNLSIVNTTTGSISEDIWFAVGDISEYAHITNVSDGGSLVSSGSHILWPHLTIGPGDRLNLTVTGYIDHNIDLTARQPYNLHSYDCTLTASFGNTTNTTIACPIVKQVESLFHRLQNTNSSVVLTIYISIFALNLIAYLSLRLRSKELRIIRRQLNTGGL